MQWVTVYQAVGQLVREFESGMHEKLIENASADVREAIRYFPLPVSYVYLGLLAFGKEVTETEIRDLNKGDDESAGPK